MKAWTVSDKNGDSGTAIVFAETSGKARALVLRCDCNFDDYEWTDLRVRRFKAWDSHYKGIAMPDPWNNDEERIELVRDFGWSCFDPYYEQCKVCPAKIYCKGDESDY